MALSSPCRSCRVLVVAATALLVTAAGGTTGAQEIQSSTQSEPRAVRLSAEVAAVPADSPTLVRAESELKQLTSRRIDLGDEMTQQQEALTRNRADIQAVSALAARRSEQAAKAVAIDDRTRSTLSSLGVERFVVGDHMLKGLDPTLNADEAARLSRMRVLGDIGAETLVDQHRYTRERAERLADEHGQLVRRRDELDREIARGESRVAQLSIEMADMDRRIATAERTRDEAKLGATVRGTDLSTVALDAYWRAARLFAQVDPACGITWPVLAGIGRTETGHGTYRGAGVGFDGVVRPPIFGPDLDGTNSFAVVGDSDGGLLDGTSRTDRAVGPMQFLPSTWRAVGVDADGDGIADPHDMYDAAASAAEYLCRSGPGLTNPARLRSAILTYNRSQEYADLVIERAGEYSEKVSLP